jgi:hypothetical protein
MPVFLGNMLLIIHHESLFMNNPPPPKKKSHTQTHIHTHTLSLSLSLSARRYLNWKFSSWWISIGGPIARPSHSPNLNPVDLCLWGHLKTLVCSSSVDDETLKNWIVSCFQTQHSRDCFWVAMRHQAESCMQDAGGHMELYHRVLWRAECHRVTLKTWKICISLPMLV